MNIKILSTLILCVASTQVFAESPYWIGTGGDFVRDRDGKCVRTIFWTPETAIDECEGIEAKVEAKAKAEVKPDPVKEEPVAVVPVPVVKVAEPEYTSLSISARVPFEFEDSALSAKSKAAVVELMAQFEDGNVHSIAIEGHTDSSGDADFNKQLSEKRAEAVKVKLVARGVDADKITTVGFGEANPVADNNTRAGRIENRRVEIKMDGEIRQP